MEREDLIEVYRALSVVVVSLDHFGSWSADQDPALATAALPKMLDEIDIFHRLANARRVLDAYFGRALGDDNMDELERELHDETGYWSAPS